MTTVNVLVPNRDGTVVSFVCNYKTKSWIKYQIGLEYFLNYIFRNVLNVGFGMIYVELIYVSVFSVCFLLIETYGRYLNKNLNTLPKPGTIYVCETLLDLEAFGVIFIEGIFIEIPNTNTNLDKITNFHHPSTLIWVFKVRNI